MICKNCNAEISDASVFCTVCGHKIESAEIPANTGIKTPAPKPRKKSTGKIVALIGAIAAVCCVGFIGLVLIAGILTDWFGLNGPAKQITSAAEKTLNAKTFTIEHVYSFDDGFISGEEEGTMQVSIDTQKRELTIFAEQNQGQVLAIYDDYLISGSEAFGYYRYDISDELDEFFDELEDLKKNDADLEEAIEDQFGNDVADDIDYDTLGKCLKKYFKKLNSKSWLKENAGYSVKKEDGVKIHCFSPDIYKFCEVSLPFFEKAFEDKDTYEDLEDDLRRAKSDMQDTDVIIKVGVKSGKLVSIDVESITDETESQLELKFTKIGNTKIDYDDLDDLIDRARIIG